MQALFLAPLLLLAPQQNQLPAHLHEGVRLLHQGKPAEAAVALDALLRQDPEDGQAWYYYGLARHQSGLLDEALRGHLMATLLVQPGHPFRTNAAFNTACAYALTGRPDRSLQWLHRARNLGFSSWAQVEADSDLDALREDARLAAFLDDGTLAGPAPGSATVESVTEVLPGGTGGVAIDAEGVLYVADFGDRVYRVRQDGAAEVLATGFVKAADCTLDADGHLLQVDHGTGRVWRISPEGEKVDLEVDGVVAPVGIDTAPDGSFFLTDYRVDAILHVRDGETRTVAAGGLLHGPNGLAHAGERGLYVVNFNDGAVLQVDPESGAVRFVAELPGAGNGHVAWSGEALYVTGRKGHRVFRVTPEGRITTVAGTGAQGTVDGDAAASQLSLPNGIALSDDGRRLFVNDALGGKRNVVRRITLAEGEPAE